MAIVGRGAGEGSQESCELLNTAITSRSEIAVSCFCCATYDKCDTG